MSILYFVLGSKVNPLIFLHSVNIYNKTAGGEREGEKEREGGGEGVWDNQLWEVLLALICLEIDHMGAFLKSTLSIDVKNNLKRST